MKMYMNCLSVAAFFFVFSFKKGNFWENPTLVNRYLFPVAMVTKMCNIFLIFHQKRIHLSSIYITALLKIKNRSFWMGFFESKITWKLRVFPLCCHGNNGKVITSICYICCKIQFSKFVNVLISFTLHLHKLRIKLKILSFQEMLNGYCQPLLSFFFQR